MIIEIHTPHDGLKEPILRHAKQAMIRLSHLYKSIARIECVWREDQVINPPENKVCEIRVTIFGENQFTHSRSVDYSLASSEAFEHISQQLSLLASRARELPDRVTTTVKV